MPLQHRGARGAVVDPVGNHHALLGRHDVRLGVRAQRRLRVRDPLAGLRLGHARADRLDHARALAPEHERHLRRVEPAAQVRVDEVDPDRGLAHQDLARARRRAPGCR